MTIKVAVVGALGKMGTQVVKAVTDTDGFDLVCAIDKYELGFNVHDDIVIEGDIKTAFELKKPDVVIDFTQPDTIFENIKIYMELGVKSVIGTTGLDCEQLNELRELSNAKNTGCFIAPNFSTGAILMMKFARLAAKYFNNAEILEFHHNQKKDAPSGTAIKTAQLMCETNKNLKLGNCAETELISGARGANYTDNNGDGNICIHSVRMPGFVASQEVIFGALGQTLKIRHDSINRECYMDGVLMATKYVFENNSFVYGLENIL
ncbi:TPA: 4-hydroxy-tetrahydrodipicolinate reductase [Candidatus Galligastranaerophilus intestinavium]|uniref:4-hydroxy-tetrahydrodipicolinate reductase n=1 Tax=Candidatus Galligastranaerophilus intestinavium TaxID=2840836 RepID=A0A9D1FHX7_9BACT|nr:4-hydroxy-tetrahydrodipicolinate reductase [Candidatus Galligastranaerophilus intestinavium]